MRVYYSRGLRCGAGILACTLRPPTSDLRPPTSDLRPLTSDLLSRRRALAVGQRDARYRAEGAEQTDPAGDDVELVIGGVFGFRVERDVFRVLDEDAVAAFEDEHEAPKGDG